ncbi:SusC/RagA family TonB-linked outer membrane protein [Gynurincola endophyticus]|uniref:SusC/RagA family TonB-linked outer membrane protein n=1 Tax=Gynurincola endophyticus TaxID=2479004 RepID=UPI000F8E09C1|nr:TonB-dependent receptor [Gynurincola endophyticus]
MNTFRKLCLWLLCLSLSATLHAQNIIITGKITDEQGQPLEGASVGSKDGKHSALSLKDGSFQLSVASSIRELVFSFVGMESQTHTIGSKRVINVRLTAKSDLMNEAIVIGYGTVKKSDLTGAVQRISAEDLVRENPINIVQAMQGKLAGVNITQNDGAPGAGLSMRIRGSNSFTGGTEPLYVIDGVPFNNSNSGSTPAAIGDDEKQTLNVLSFLNVNDIESIDVLKDASATAIYGARGANGVVIITTKKGKAGKDRIDFNSTVGVAQVSKKIDVLNPYDYVRFQNLAYENANKYDGTSYTLPFPDVETYRNQHINWQDQVFRSGISQNHSIAISGGNENGTHNISFNYIDQEGIIQNSDYNKIGLNIGLHRNIGSRIKIGTSSTISRTITNGVKTGTDKSDAASAGIIRSLMTYPTHMSSVEAFDGEGADFFITNPVIYTRDVLNRVTNINIFTSNYLEVKLSNALKFRQNVGFNYTSGLRDQYYPSTVYEGFSMKGWGMKADNIWNSLLSESILTYTETFGKSSITAMGGMTYENINSQWKRAEAKTFTNDFLANENLQMGEVVMPVIGNRSEVTNISYLGRINYNYDDRYLITASFRNDGSSKFGANNKFGFFPSAGFAWKILNEDFMKNVTYFSDLKLRLSYGVTGGAGIPSYGSLPKLVVNNYPFNGNLQSGLGYDVTSGPPNPDLRWERTEAYNLGLDMGFMNNRISVTVDAYSKITNDLLQYVAIPNSTGYTRKLINSGSVRNRGIEVVVNADIVKKKDFEWTSNFNISFNRNKILSLGSDHLMQFAGNISTSDAPFVQMVGQPIGALWGYIEDGYYDNEAEVRHDLQYTNQAPEIIRRMVGEIKYRNLDGDPSAITIEDRTLIGDVNPNYTLGLNNRFRYKNFDLSFFIHAVQGNDVINMNTRFNANLGGNKNITYDMWNSAWAEGQDNSQIQNPKIMRQFWRSFLFSRRFVEDGSFVRLRNITVGYNVPLRNTEVIKSLRVGLSINNLFTITNYSGYDPEVNSYGDNPALFGVDLGGYPNARSYNLSLRCNF